VEAAHQPVVLGHRHREQHHISAAAEDLRVESARKNEGAGRGRHDRPRAPQPHLPPQRGANRWVSGFETVTSIFFGGTIESGRAYVMSYCEARSRAISTSVGA